MTISQTHFRAFFALLHEGHEPFAWQVRLLDYLIRHGRWPSQIAAPTGAGKTAVIDVHVFAAALMAAGVGPRVPRRLALVVDRRALVDSQHDLANVMNRLLRDAARDGNGVLSNVARLLYGLRIRTNVESGAGPLTVALLRGGTVPDRHWVDDPQAVALISATPDMWGSRLLFRGYGTSTRARPREAGLLAYDAVVVIDEAHLSRQLVATARRVAQLEAAAPHRPSVEPLQVVATTATQEESADASRLAVEPADLHGASASANMLRRRLASPKPVRLVEVGEWPARTVATRRTLARAIATEASELRTKHGPTVACVVNTVGLALALVAELRDRGLVVEVIVGRLRPHNLRRLRERRPGLLTPVGDRSVDVVVATQTVEVGLDADFSAMVTELAPGSALAQRAGRVNRLGERSTTQVRIVVPRTAATVGDAPPYSAADLTAALGWLRRRAEAAAGLAPATLADDPPPPTALPRGILGRVEPWHLAVLARTSDELFEEPDLELFIADELAREADAGIVVRSGLPAEDAEALVMLRATPPRADECFPVAIGAARKLLAERDIRWLLWRNGEPHAPDPAARLQPGDILVVEPAARLFTLGVVDLEGDETADDVFDDLRERGPLDASILRLAKDTPLDEATGGLVGRIILPGLDDVITEYPDDSRARRYAMAAVLEGVLRRHSSSIDESTAGRFQRFARLLRGRLADVEVAIGGGADDPVSWVVLSEVGRRYLDDEDARQTWSPSAGAVELDRHQMAVGDLAGEMAERLGLGPTEEWALDRAGRHHDQGKADPRFQVLLRGEGDGSSDGPRPLLAKSGLRSPAQTRAARAAAGLPLGWRHEQLSAAYTAARLGITSAESMLAVRLVGTSHGHGRVAFPHASAGLFGDQASDLDELSRDLFDAGAWDEVVMRTHRAHGVWGCAYLEAILRAADSQISRQGG